MVDPAGMNGEFNTAAYGERGVEFAFASFGRRIAISLDDSSLLASVLDVLPSGWIPSTVDNVDTRIRIDWLRESASPSERAGYCLYQDDVQRQWAPDADGMTADLEQMLEHDVAEFADPWLFMHAGVIAWEGQAIVLPGASHAGKSTLVAALVEAGATYFSDEYAVLDAEGHVLPFPRRLSLRDGPLGPTGRVDLRHHAPSQNELAHPLPIGRVMMLRYRESSHLRMNMLQAGAAIMEMCNHMVAIQRRPKEVLAALGTITRRAQIVNGERGDARQAARGILDARDAIEYHAIICECLTTGQCDVIKRQTIQRASSTHDPGES